MTGWFLAHRLVVTAVYRGAAAGVVTEVPAASAPDHQVLIALIAALGSLGVALITVLGASGLFRRQTPSGQSSAEVAAELARAVQQERERAEELQRQLDARNGGTSP